MAVLTAALAGAVPAKYGRSTRNGHVWKPSPVKPSERQLAADATPLDAPISAVAVKPDAESTGSIAYIGQSLLN